MKYTVLGGNGFIGQALVSHLKSMGKSVFAPSRAMLGPGLEALEGKNLGHLIYCIGLTADFRQRPLETVEANVCLLNRLLEKGEFLSLTYLSSTRLYADSDTTDENTRLMTNPHSLDSLYNISKMMGESACMNASKRARVVRLSNVYGFPPDSHNFLMAILYEAATAGKVKFQTSSESAKDFVALSDVVRLLPAIAERGDFGIYNLASGVNTSNREIANCLREEGVVVEFAPDGPLWNFPEIDIRKISLQFDPPHNRLIDDLPDLLNRVWSLMAKKTDPVKTFEAEKFQRIIGFGKDEAFIQLSREWLYESMRKGYTYNFNWLGRPVIQYPMDMIAFQEIVWEVQPDLIIETGIAHGGSLMMSATLLALLDYCDAAKNGESLNSAEPRRRVLGIDIDIREHNRAAIEAHPMFSRIQMIEGSSISAEVIEQVHSIAKDYKRILVCLDSMHTQDHVLAELEAYAPLVSKGSYCIVFDTFIEDTPDNMFPNRPWAKGNNPKTAVWEFLKTSDRFVIDKKIENKLLITAAPDGYLKCVKDNL